MNPARLAELHHQRALVREHLAWLDREIARESPALTPLTTAAAAIAPAVPIPVESSASDTETYVPDPVSAAADTKRGCLVAAAVVLLLFFAGLAAIYFLRYRDRPLFFPAAQSSGTGRMEK